VARSTLGPVPDRGLGVERDAHLLGISRDDVEAADAEDAAGEPVLPA